MSPEKLGSKKCNRWKERGRGAGQVDRGTVSERDGEKKQVKGQRVGEALVLVPTDTLLQLIQIRVSKTGRLNLQASQQYRDCCQPQSLTMHTHTPSVCVRAWTQ